MRNRRNRNLLASVGLRIGIINDKNNGARPILAPLYLPSLLPGNFRWQILDPANAALKGAKPLQLFEFTCGYEVPAHPNAKSKATGIPLPSLHSSLFLPTPEPTIRTGVVAMTPVVLRLMSK